MITNSFSRTHLIKPQKVPVFTVLEARGLQSRCHAPSEGSGKTPSWPVPSIWWFLAVVVFLGLWMYHITPVSAAVFTWLSPCVSVTWRPNLPLLSLIKAPVIGFRAQSKSRMILSEEA